jgi:DNA polymerase III epsilon subunit-like protein
MPSPELTSFVSVDVETAGPNPGDYALLSIGACLVAVPETSFYVELQPDRSAQTPEAAAVHGLSMEALAAHARPPAEAMADFAAWLEQAVPPPEKPIFVAFNAPFDWMFVNEYFHRYLGHNPFGHSALDIKSYYMGRYQVRWRESGFRYVAENIPDEKPLSHHALEDARDQARIFCRILASGDGPGDAPQTYS